ncbi:hypothetical protein OS493_038519 [Desmophyllum pertusum]|uniref:Uncharacterized protein n=1 Tax=Desmophyllum pertusum TaxID=174260 RepID=A0A9X0CUA8_9CNID|nr:hypothetical protein OS493_038519 [Desmophyllum pertusum]
MACGWNSTQQDPYTTDTSICGTRDQKTKYNKLKTSHNIDGQSTSGRLQRWPPRKVLKYENINGNGVHPKLGGRYNYALFDCRVTSHVDFARLYVENYMAKFNAFDDHCDASAVMALLGGVPVFSAAVQTAAGTHLCVNSPVDSVLLHLVQQELKTLQDAVDNMSVEFEEEKTKVQHELQNVARTLKEMEQKVQRLETGQQILETGQQRLGDWRQQTLETGQQKLDIGQQILETGQQKTLDSRNWRLDAR